MSTPRFKIRQDNDFIYIDINVPYVRISNCDFYIENTLFSFYCKPYFLKLHLPKEIVDDDRAKAIYNLEEENGTIHVTAPKKNPGEHFEDLQMLTKLLSKSSTLNIVDNVNTLKNTTGRSLIEVISSSNNDNANEEDDANSRKPPAAKTTLENANDNVKQNTLKKSTASNIPSMLILSKDDTSDVNTSTTTISAMDDLVESINNITLKTTVTYGFNNRFSNFFAGLRDELVEIIELETPDKTPIKQRSILRVEKEEEDFDLERYAGDYAYGKEDPIYIEAVRMKPYWSNNTNNNKNNSDNKAKKKDGDADTKKEGSDEEFDENERELLIRLPRREYLIDEHEETHSLLCGLSSILYGFAYDFRTANGESNVESSWTISTLSPLLSWLDECNNNLELILISCMRRSLIYPYLRSYKLSNMIIHDVVAIFQSGKHVVLQTLLKIYKIYEKSETKYMINKLFIEDYCVWIQTVKDNVIRKFADEIKAIDLNKSKLDLELEYIEEQVNEQLQSQQGE
jgi:protein SHQ1